MEVVDSFSMNHMYTPPVLKRCGGIDVHYLSQTDSEAAAALIANAFTNEPLTKIAFDLDDESTRQAYIQALKLAVEQHLAAGHPVLAARQGRDGLVGLALVKGYRHRPGLRERLTSRVKRMPKVARLMRHARLHGIRTTMLTKPPEGLPPNYYLLEVLAVAPQARGNGIGRLLLEELHSIVEADWNSSGVYLVTADETPRRLYNSFGYKEIDTRAREDLVVSHMFWENPAAPPIADL